MRGVVAAGHPLTAEAGAEVIREGGNAVDAAVCAVLASFALESPLTGLGAGGFMIVHTPAGETALIDFFVDAPGREGTERGEELLPIDVYFDPSTPQVFNVGAASCGVPGTAAGLELALERFGTMPLEALIGPGVRHAREGVAINRQQAFVFEILAPIYTMTPEVREIYAPEGRILREGELFRFPELAEALERLAAEGSRPFYEGDVGQAVADFVRDRGGTLSRSDMAGYRAIEREPVRASFRGCEILTNPPPSSGGILIAFALEVLERLGRADVEALVAVMRAAGAARGEGFSDGLRQEGFAHSFLDGKRLDAAAERTRAGLGAGGSASPGDALGSTTHLAAIDAEGCCASVTCSNGTGSGILVPGTGVHVNNMLGEEDLNPHGFHLVPIGTRLPSMMSPTLVLREGEVVAGLGSAGSNRIRSAVLQTIVRMLAAEGVRPADAIDAGRLHFEAGVVQAEPGVEESGLRRLEERGTPVIRWDHKNLFFGGVQAVARDPASGELGGAGDPRRGGAAVAV
ncbi:MAG TPA: gamma-glutamyltransferase [Solirubrobacterales bacterium]|nr:gamma-glutamyltransferase [Solirubrobacterales bacterium]